MTHFNSYEEFEKHLTEIGYTIVENQDLIIKYPKKENNKEIYVLYYQYSRFSLESRVEYYRELRFEKCVAYDKNDIITALNVLDGTMPESLFLFDQNHQLDHTQYINCGSIAPQKIKNPDLLINYGNAY